MHLPNPLDLFLHLAFVVHDHVSMHEFSLHLENEMHF